MPGLWYRDEQGNHRQGPPASLVPADRLAAELPGMAFDLLPMKNYRAHNWHCFDRIHERQPYASVYTSLGCPFRCSFCCITEHQGRDVVSRSEGSILREIEGLQEVPGYTGVVSDVGGPTANMWQMTCTDETWHKACRRASCLYPSVCEKFGNDHGPLVQLYKKAQKAENKVKKTTKK